MKIAVCGGKGGVGKSTVALNLAATMDGVVIDCDLTMANLPSEQGPDLFDILHGRASVIEAVRRRNGVRVLSCGRSLADAADLDPAALVDVVEAVAQREGDVVLDCPAGLRGDVGLPLSVADRFLPVTVPTRASVADALRTRGAGVAYETGLAGVVVNRVTGEPPLDRIRGIFGAPATPIPDTDRLAGELQAPAPVVNRAPESRPARQFHQIASTIGTGAKQSAVSFRGPGTSPGASQA